MERGYCVHRNGEVPNFCIKYATNQSECESDCTSLASCVGYEVYTKYNECYLYPANNSCHSSYEFHEGNLTDFAIKLSDLKGKDGDGYFPTSRCYGKIDG